MTRTQRAALLGAAAIVLIGAFAFLRPNDDEPSRPAIATAPDSTPAAANSATAKPEQADDEDGPLLVRGRTQRIEVGKGDRVRLRARSSSAEELHVHGYDLRRDVEPGQSTRLVFAASIEGIFEIEFENSGAKVASLVVRP